MTRQAKTEKQRAQEAHAVAFRKYDRLLKRTQQLRADLDAAQAELEEADRILAYRAGHPALQKSTTTPTTTEETTRP